MKYRIFGFSQAKAVEFGLNLKELLFLRWFLDFMKTLKMQHIELEGKMFFWVDNRTIAKELPILGIKSRRGIRKLLAGLEKKGIIERHTFHKRFCFIRLIHEKIEALIDRNVYVGTNVPTRRNKRSYHESYIQKSLYNNDNNTYSISEILRKEFRL